METFVQHLLNAGFQARQQRPDVLYQDVIQGFGQVVQAAMGRHAAVLRMCIEELQLCSSGLSNIAAAYDVLLTAIDHPCTRQ